jgi:predicted O-methyltransferase YrrM
VIQRLADLELSNANVRLAQDIDYFGITDFQGPSFDLAIIDGSYRWKCVEAVLPRMRPGGLVYLDNSDADKDRRWYPDPSMRHAAQRILQEYCDAHPGTSLMRYSSLLNGELHAGEGMALCMPE